MKTQEIMIGDWVLFDRNYAEDNPMYTIPDYQPFKIESGEDIDLADETNCIGDASVYQPIPLTAEILEKNGFVHNDNGMSFAHSWEQFGLSVYGNGLIKCSQNVIQYVHQLQHVLRLCGIENEIQL